MSNNESTTKGDSDMQLPRWATTGNDTFWRRHYELATLTEQACEQVIEQQLEKWLRDVEFMDGPAPAEENAAT